MNLKKRYGLFKSGTGRLEKRFFKRCPVIIQIALIFVCASVLPAQAFCLRRLARSRKRRSLLRRGLVLTKRFSLRSKTI